MFLKWNLNRGLYITFFENNLTWFYWLTNFNYLVLLFHEWFKLFFFFDQLLISFSQILNLINDFQILQHLMHFIWRPIEFIWFIENFLPNDYFWIIFEFFPLMLKILFQVRLNFLIKFREQFFLILQNLLYLFVSEVLQSPFF